MLSKKLQPSPQNQRLPFTNITNVVIESKRPLSFHGNNGNNTRQNRITSLLQAPSDLVQTKKQHHHLSFRQEEKVIHPQMHTPKSHLSSLYPSHQNPIPNLQLKIKTHEYSSLAKSNQKAAQAKTYLVQCNQIIDSLNQQAKQLKANLSFNQDHYNSMKEEIKTSFQQQMQRIQKQYKNRCQQIQSQRAKNAEEIRKEEERIRERLTDFTEARTDIDKHMTVIRELSKEDFRMIMDVYWKKIDEQKNQLKLQPAPSIPLRTTKPNLFSFSKNQVALVSSPQELQESVVSYAFRL